MKLLLLLMTATAVSCAPGPRGEPLFGNLISDILGIFHPSPPQTPRPRPRPRPHYRRPRPVYAPAPAPAPVYAPVPAPAPAYAPAPKPEVQILEAPDLSGGPPSSDQYGGPAAPVISSDEYGGPQAPIIKEVPLAVPAVPAIPAEVVEVVALRTDGDDEQETRESKALPDSAAGNLITSEISTEKDNLSPIVFITEKLPSASINPVTDAPFLVVQQETTQQPQDIQLLNFQQPIIIDLLASSGPVKEIEEVQLVVVEPTTQTVKEVEVVEVEPTQVVEVEPTQNVGAVDVLEVEPTEKVRGVVEVKPIQEDVEVVVVEPKKNFFTIEDSQEAVTESSVETTTVVEPLLRTTLRTIVDLFSSTKEEEILEIQVVTEEQPATTVASTESQQLVVETSTAEVVVKDAVDEVVATTVQETVSNEKTTLSSVQVVDLTVTEPPEEVRSVELEQVIQDIKDIVKEKVIEDTKEGLAEKVEALIEEATAAVNTIRPVTKLEDVTVVDLRTQDGASNEDTTQNDSLVNVTSTEDLVEAVKTAVADEIKPLIIEKVEATINQETTTSPADEPVTTEQPKRTFIFSQVTSGTTTDTTTDEVEQVAIIQDPTQVKEFQSVEEPTLPKRKFIFKLTQSRPVGGAGDLGSEDVPTLPGSNPTIPAIELVLPQLDQSNNEVGVSSAGSEVPLLDREAGVFPTVPGVPQTNRGEFQPSEERVPKTLSSDAAFTEAEGESGQAEPDVPVPRSASREGYYQHQYTDNFSNWYYARHGF